MDIVLYLVLSLSVALNFYFFVYARFLIRNLISSKSSIEELNVLFSNFREHVELIHESEMFYGDQSLQNLISHSKHVLEELSRYDESLEFIEAEIEDEKEEE